MSRSAVLRYYVYEATRNAHLSGPIWVVFLLSRGVSYTGVGLLDAVFSVTIVLAEAPTGYLGDRLGRRRSLLIGTVGASLGSLAFAFGSSLPTFLAAYVLLAVARTFTSGSDEAWLYDTLRAETDSDQFARIRGRGKSIGLAVSAVAALAGGLLGTVNLAWPWLASAATTALAVPVVATFPEPDPEALDDADAGSGGDDTASDSDDPLGPLAALRIARGRLLAGGLCGFLLLSGVFTAVMGVVGFFVQPVTRDALAGTTVDSFGLAGVTVGGFTVDGIVALGVVFAAFRLVAAAVTARTGWIEERLGAAGWFRLAPTGFGVVLAGVVAVPVAAVPVFFLLRAVRSVTAPLRGQYVNDRTPSVGRATTLSAVSVFDGVLVAPFELVGGRVADAIGPLATTSLLGGLLVSVALVSPWTYRDD
ncbi:MFS transporter [Halobaculum sp. MBLA0143]|uniref:MFS transporter n=1 Tax=Halobaculum sp. MBLA0143 TaxID=3079933 RepID=UPI0035267956